MNKKQPTAQWMNRTTDETGTFAQRLVNWFRDAIGPRRTESVRPVRSKPVLEKGVRKVGGKLFNLHNCVSM
jgi:hypothetical protein